jgi:hypothetical protein
MSTEKRKFERTNVFLLVELRRHNKSQDFSLAISTNLSSEGAVIESQGYDLRAGEILELIIKHPESDVSVSALGQIVWKKDAWYKCLMGMKFIKIEKEDKNNIIKLMTASQDSTSEPTYHTGDAEEALPQHPDEADSETEYAAHMSASEASVESVDDTLDKNDDIASSEIQSDEAVLNAGPFKSDAPDSVAPVNEIPSQAAEKTESENEEYEIKLNRAETSRHVAVDVSSLKVEREIRDEKELSLKPLVSVLTIIVAVIALIYFEDISRSFKLIGSGSDSSATVSLPATTASSDHPDSETTNNVLSPPEVRNNSGDDLSTRTGKHEMTVEESISSPPAVNELAKKDPPMPANTDEKQSLPSPIKETPDPSTPLISAKATNTRQTQNKTEKKRSLLPENNDPVKKLTAPVRAVNKPPQKTFNSLQRRKPAPKLYKPRIKAVLLDNTNGRFTVYEELFNNNDNRWDIFDTESSSAIIINGEYRMESKIVNGSLINLHYHVFPHDGDFEIESHVKSEMDGKNQAYGLVFGARDILNNYVFKVTSEGSYSIGKYVMGIWKELRGGKIRDGIIRHNSTNVLMIGRKNQKVHFFVNNTYLNNYSIKSFDGKQIGFIVQGKTVMAVDGTRSLIESQIQ